MNDDQKAGGSGQVFVVTNSDIYLRSLAAGVVLPVSCVPEYGDAVTGADPNVLPTVTQGLSAGMVEKIRDTRPGLCPVLLEIEMSRLVRPNGNGVGATRLTGPLPLNMVRCAVFPGEEELSDFKAMPFEDLDLGSVATRVDAGCFDAGAACTIDPSVEVESRERGDLFEMPLPIDLRDNLAGGVCCLLQALPRKMSWADTLIGMLFGERPRKGDLGLELITDAVAGLVADEAGGVLSELRAAVAVFSNLSSRDGWESTSVIESIAERMEKADSGKKKVLVVSKWRGRALDILENRTDCDPLTDEGRIVLRGILLACLRKEPEAVIAADDTYLRAGPQVRAVAAFLTGLSSGFSRLSLALKRFERRLDFAWVLRERLIMPGGGAELPFLRTECAIEREMGEDLTKSLDVWLDGCKIFGFQSEAPPIAQQILAMSRNVGFPLRVDPETGYLKYTVEWRNGRRQPVYVSVLDSKRDSMGNIRFVSPCEHLPMIEGAGDSVAAMKAMRSSRAVVVARPQLLEMLFHQSQPDWHCRFIIDYRLAAVCIAVDQMVSTLDSDELTHHLMHVARIADEFELGKGRDEFR